jgi:hypothetical protein
MPNYEPVIDKLLNKSEAGAVPWKPTYEEDTFVAALEGEVTFEIRRLDDGGYQFLMKDQNDKKIIEMACHDRMPGHFDYVNDDRYFEKVSRLFEAARVKALDVDRKLTVAEALLDRF